MFGKADPYCSIRIGTQDFSTKPVVGGGKNPIWNEQFVFDISNEKELDMEVLGKFKSFFVPCHWKALFNTIHHILIINCLDKETVGNDKFMGRCQVSIIEWIAQGKFEGDLELLDKAGKPVSFTFLRVAPFESSSQRV